MLPEDSNSERTQFCSILESGIRSKILTVNKDY